MEEERILFAGGRKHRVFIHIERRNSIRVSLTRRGVIIRAPRHLRVHEREKEIETMITWAQKRLNEDPEHQYKKKRYEHEDYLKTNSKIYQLHITTEERKKNFSKITGGNVIMKISSRYNEEERQEYISKQLRKLLAKQHHKELETHVQKINKEHFGKEIRKISYRYTISRWGACKTEDKEIQLSTKLLLAPLPVLEYVIIHEIAHLIEANHSRRFWNIVKSVDSTYKEKVRWLKKHGHTLEI